MRKLFGLVAVAALALAGQAQAAAVPFTGSLAVQISSLPAISVTGAGVAVINGSGGGAALTSIQLAGGTFAAVASVPVTDPAAFPIGGVKAAPTNGPRISPAFNLGGQMAVQGVSNVCLFAACNGGPVANVNVPFTQNGTRGVGLGGAPIVVAGLVNVTVQGAPWTTGIVSIGTSSQQGFVHGPASGGAESAAAASGVIKLVTPVTINTNIGASPTLPAFGILTLHFDPIPEPGTLMLLASGVVGLGILGRRKMSK